MVIEPEKYTFADPWYCIACGGRKHLVYVLRISQSLVCTLGMVALHVTVVTGVNLVMLFHREWEFRFPYLYEFWLLQSCSRADLIEHLLFCLLRIDLERASKSRVYKVYRVVLSTRKTGVFLILLPQIEPRRRCYCMQIRVFYTNRPRRLFAFLKQT